MTEQSSNLKLLLDRQEIADLLARYTFALDTRDWELLGECFTDTGVTDFGAGLGRFEGRDAVVNMIRTVLSGFDATQHLLGNVVIEVAGDAATATSYLQAQHFLVNGEGGSTSTIGGTYRDELVRDGKDWRIQIRVFEMSWRTGNSGVFALAMERGGRSS